MSSSEELADVNQEKVQTVVLVQAHLVEQSTTQFDVARPGKQRKSLAQFCTKSDRQALFPEQPRYSRLQDLITQNVGPHFVEHAVGLLGAHCH